MPQETYRFSCGIFLRSMRSFVAMNGKSQPGIKSYCFDPNYNDPDI